MERGKRILYPSNQKIERKDRKAYVRKERDACITKREKSSVVQKGR